MANKKHIKKTCILCKYFHFDTGSPAYSELTPGMDFNISCTKGKWRVEIEEDTRKEYREKMESAETCKLFMEAVDEQESEVNENDQ